MEMNAFNPPRVEIVIEDTLVLFKPFSLYEKAWALQEFATKDNHNGLEVLATALERLDMLTVARFAWRLVDNKGDIKKGEFFRFCEDNRNLVIVYQALCKTLTNSEPTERHSRKLSELKKS